MRKFFKEWKWVILFGFLILLIALGIRLYNLTLLPVFTDEAIYVRWSQVMRAEPTLRFVPLSDGKQPLYMWLVIPFFKLFTDPLFAGRIVSVLAGTGTLIGIFVLGNLLFKSKKTALISSLIYAISPFSFFFDRMALADSLLSFFGVWIAILGYLTVTFARLDLAMITGFLLGGALLTKSPALFFTLLLPTLGIFAQFPKGKKEILLHLGKLIGLYGVILLIGYGMYQILRLGPNFQMIAIRNKDYVYPISHIFSSFADPLKPFLIRAWEWIVGLGPWTVLVLALCGIVLNIKKHSRSVLILFAWFFLPIFAQSEFGKVFTARYIFFTLPYLFLLAGSAFMVTNKILKIGLTITLFVFVLLSFKNDYFLLTQPELANLPRSERSGYLEEWTSGYGNKEIADYLIDFSLKNPNEKLVVGTEGYFGTLPDGLLNYTNSYSNIIVIGQDIPIKEVSKSLYESRKSGNPTYLVVNSDRFWMVNPPELTLLAVYPKGVRPDGSRETLYFFEVNNNILRKAKPKL